MLYSPFIAMVNCAIVGCSQKQGKHKGVRFFGIPTVITNQCAKTRDLSRRRRAEWIARINRKEITDETVRRHTKICGKHFVQGYPSSLFDSGNQDWSPSLYLGHGNPEEHQIDCGGPTKLPKSENGSEHFTQNAEDSFQEDASTFVSCVLNCKEEPSEDDTVMMVCDCSAVPEEDDTQPVISGVHQENAVGSANFVVETKHEVCEETSIAQTQTCCNELSELRMEREVLLQELTCSKSELSECLHKVEMYHQELTRAKSALSECSHKVEMYHQELTCVKSELSECSHKVEIYHKTLEEKNLSLFKSNLKVKELEKKIDKLQASNVSLMKTCNDLKCNFSFSEDSFKDDDCKVGYYTGLPSFAVLMRVFNLVNENVKDSGAYAVPKFQQFLMALMWLRLGLEEQDLAYRFGVSQSTASRILHRWLNVMSNSLDQFIVWPNRETLETSMPPSFQENWKKSVVVIIDSFEVLAKPPMALVSRAEPHKHHKTVKFLIGITPQGIVAFISKAWADGTSDKHITEHCGLLDKLMPGDIVMANRGFNLTDSGGIVGAKLAVSAITDGKLQLNFDDVQLTKQTPSVRNEIEKVVGLVRRKYKILRTTVPLELLTKKPGDELASIDHVTRVCCALTNLCANVVPFESTA